jgi:hypothetical protein
MPNLIDKLIPKVDLLRQKAADKFGLPAFDMYRVIRTYASGTIGEGSFTEASTKLSPPPMVKFTGADQLERGGKRDARKMKATEVSLSYTEAWLQGSTLSAGQICYYKLVDRNSTTQQATTTWVLNAIPDQTRDQIYWELDFNRFDMC